MNASFHSLLLYFNLQRTLLLTTNSLFGKVLPCNEHTELDVNDMHPKTKSDFGEIRQSSFQLVAVLLLTKIGVVLCTILLDASFINMNVLCYSNVVDPPTLY